MSPRLGWPKSANTPADTPGRRARSTFWKVMNVADRIDRGPTRQGLRTRESISPFGLLRRGDAHPD
jgi:hypothetical protein